jgi:hypothetical protein
VRNCPNCHSVNLDSNEFCDECGSPFPVEKKTNNVIAVPTPQIKSSCVENTSSSQINNSLLLQVNELLSRGREINDTVDEIAEEGIVIQDIKIPFGSMVVIIIKWSLAAIPAAIILFIIGAILSAIFGGLFAAIFH